MIHAKEKAKVLLRAPQRLLAAAMITFFSFFFFFSFGHSYIFHVSFLFAMRRVI